MTVALPSLLMVDADGRFQFDPTLTDMPVKPNEYGVTAAAGCFGTLRFVGVPVANLTAEQRSIEVVLALPDLLLLRDQLAVMVERAVAAEVLQIPDDYAPVVAP